MDYKIATWLIYFVFSLFANYFTFYSSEGNE